MPMPEQEDDRYAAFERRRNRIKQETGAAQGEAGEAIARRFAAMGSLNSGASIKATQQAQDQVAQKGAQAVAEVDDAETAERARQADIVAAQKYQTAEREGAQQFQKGMFDADLQFKQQIFSDESKARWAQHDLALKEFAASEKANEINAIIGLGNADMSSEDFAHYVNQFRGINGGGTIAAPPKPELVGFRPEWSQLPMVTQMQLAKSPVRR